MEIKLEKQFDFSKEGNQKQFDNLSERAKKEIVDKSHREANTFKGKVELGEVRDYEQACDEFDEEFINKTKEELSKEQIPEKINLKETLKNLKPIQSYDPWNRRKLYQNEEYLKHSEKSIKWSDMWLGYAGGYAGLGEYDKLQIAYPDYEVSYDWEAVSRAENFLFRCDDGMEVYETLKLNQGNLGEIGYELPKRDEVLPGERKFNPEKFKEMLKAYSKAMLHDNSIIVINGKEMPRKFDFKEYIEKEMKAGKDIVEILKQADIYNIIEIINMPAYYTDGDAMEEREKEINDHIQAAKDDIKSYIKDRLMWEVERKILIKRKNDEKQKDLEMRRKKVEKKYGKYLDQQNLDKKLIGQIKESLIRHNNTDSHSAAYREYEMTKGLKVKDNTAVFIVEESSLAMKPSSAGWGGEAINIKLIMVDDNGERILSNFRIKDRFGDTEDQLEKWYDLIEIEKIDKDKKEITVKLSKSNNPDKVDIETFSLKQE